MDAGLPVSSHSSFCPLAVASGFNRCEGGGRDACMEAMASTING